MLTLLRSNPAKLAVIGSIILVILALVFGTMGSIRNYPARTKAEIDSLVKKGDPMTTVEEALGPPDTKDASLWHYTNARRSYRTETSYVPASFGIRFDDLGKVEFVLKGPMP